jgi:hypothetical protein
MTDLRAVVEMLKKERDKLDRAIAALSGIGGGGSGSGRRKLSAAACERIAAAQRARWAKFKAKKPLTGIQRIKQGHAFRVCPFLFG